MNWALDLSLPSGGSRMTITKAKASIEPMGTTGARIKWPADTRREVRISVIPIDAASGQAEIDEVNRLALQFDGELAGWADINEGEGRMFVLREGDARRHVLIASRSLRDGFATQISMEADVFAAKEISDEWAVVEGAYDSLKLIKREEGAMLRLRPTSHEHRVRFDLPEGVFVPRWAFGMAQLARHGNRGVGRLAWGVLAADDLDECTAALHTLAEDPAFNAPAVHHEEDNGVALFIGGLVDTRGLSSLLICGSRPLGRGVAIVVATLLLGDEMHQDNTEIREILSHALTSAKTFGRARRPRASSSADEVLNGIDSFRNRVI